MARYVPGYEPDTSDFSVRCATDCATRPGLLGLIKKYFFLTRELSLINTCCWRADHEILMHDSASQSALIFVDLPDNTCVNQQ